MYKNLKLKTCHTRNEKEKRCYEERIRNVEHGSFKPLVFTTSSGMNPSSNVFYKRLASLLSERQSKPYSTTLNWIRCRLSFSVLRSAIICFRGARSSYHKPIHLSSNIDLALSEGQVVK
uniref:Uncharacterized protein n=1 Tax=Amphimedon queenslandica TaxID=400682 RepID=A0A1X7SIY7_AMPQE